MISRHTSERRSVSKSRELKRTIDFSEGDKFLVWSTNMFVQRDPITKFNSYGDCSVSKKENDDIQDFDLRWEQALL